MTPLERKVAFRSKAELSGLTLAGAAHEVCGVTWEHLSEGLFERRPLSEDVRQKFAAYIGRSMKHVFGEAAASVA